MVGKWLIPLSLSLFHSIATLSNEKAVVSMFLERLFPFVKFALNPNWIWGTGKVRGEKMESGRRGSAQE